MPTSPSAITHLVEYQIAIDQPMITDIDPIHLVPHNFGLFHRIVASIIGSIPNKVNTAVTNVVKPSIRQLVRTQARRRIPHIRHIVQSLQRRVCIRPGGLRVEIAREGDGKRTIFRLDRFDPGDNHLDPLNAGLEGDVVEMRVGV